jgi:hypothetical protein
MDALQEIKSVKSRLMRTKLYYNGPSSGFWSFFLDSVENIFSQNLMKNRYQALRHAFFYAAPPHSTRKQPHNILLHDVGPPIESDSSPNGIDWLSGKLWFLELLF